MSCKKCLFFSNIFLLNLQHIIDNRTPPEQSKSRHIWWVLHFFYLLFLYLCDPAGALFLRKFGPCSFGSIKWVTFRCLKPGLGRKWRWCGTPSNFLMSHKKISVPFLLKLMISTSHLEMSCSLHHQLIKTHKGLLRMGFYFLLTTDLLSPRVSCLMISIVSQY